MRRAAAAALLGAALAAGAAPAPAALAQAGGARQVRIPFPADDGSLTPYSFRLGYPLMTLVYDTLLWRDANGVPQPWLARSVRRGADGRTVTVTLRRDVRWHDGRPLTAADVAFTFRYVRAHPHPRFGPQLRELEGVDAPSAHTVVFRLRAPALGFFDQPLADVPVLPRHLWSRLGPGQASPPGPPVGSGPYRLTDHAPGRRYVFDANRRYFRGRPRVDRIVVPIIRRADRTFRALEQRRVDMIPVSLTPDSARGLEGFGVRVVRGPSYLGTVLMLNTRRPPFVDPSARRAIANALDLPRIIRSLGDLPGELPAVAAERGYIHPASRWASPRRLHRFDPARARVAFAELGLPPLRVLAPESDPLRREAGRQVVLALRRAGVSAALVEVSSRTLARSVGQDARSAPYDAAIWSSPALASHDPTFLGAVFGPPESAPINYSGYRSPRFEELVRRSSAAPTVRGRRTVTAAQLRLIARDAPVIPLFFAEGVYAYRPSIYDGWTFVRGSGILDKRSFLAAAPAATKREPIGDPIDRDGGEPGAGSPLTTVLLVVLAVLLVAAGFRAIAALSRTRERR